MPEIWVDVLLLVVGLVLTVGTGFFVAAEFALVNLDRADLESRRDRGERGLDGTIEALKHTSTHLSSAQLGITITTLLTGYTFQPTIAKLLAGPIEAIGLSAGVTAVVGYLVGILVATVLSMIVGELVPKNLALALPHRVARFVMPFQTLFTTVFRPAVRVLNATANAVLRAIGIEPKEELSGARTAQELSSLVRRSAMEGTLKSDTADLLSRSLSFAGHTASDVMTSRLRIASVERGQSAQEVLDLARATGYSRFPVTDEDIDDVVAIVHVKQAMAVPRAKRDEVPVGAIEQPVARVPETMKLDLLLGELRGRGYQMAIVLDEYGGTAGVVTLEDLVEELVGELVDEHDRTRAGVVRSRDFLTFPGILRPDELASQTGVKVPEDGLYETVAGYVVQRLGRLPKVGDEVVVPAGAPDAPPVGTMTVLRLDGWRIDRIRVTPAVLADEPAATR